MYKPYKQVLKKIFFIIVFLLSVTDCFSDPIESLTVNSSEISNYAVNENIILDNEGVLESYKIVSIDAGVIQLSKNIQNGVDMNVVQGLSVAYPLPVDWSLPGLVGYDVFVSSYGVGIQGYINEVTQYLLNRSNSYLSPNYSTYSFSPDGHVIFLTYFMSSGANFIQNLIKIFDKVGGVYVSRGAGLMLRTEFSYADVNFNTIQILALAGVIVIALASILSVKKAVKLMMSS